MVEKTRALLIVCTLVFGFGLLADLGLLMFSPMLFDAPGSERAVFPWLIVGCLFLYPLLVVVGLGLGWRALARGNSGRAAKLALLPALGIALLVAVFVALDVLCDGQFACR